MAYFCPDCRITFESRVSNCPSCGFGIASDDRSEDYYLGQGYTRYQSPRRPTSSGIHIEDDDVLGDLRRRYNNRYASPTTPSEPAPSSEPVRESGETPSQPNDFFAGFTNNDLHTPETRVDPEPETPREEPTASRPATPRRRTTSERTHSYTTPRRRFGFGNFGNQIPWRALIYFALFVAVISIIVGIWNMRFAILDSVVGFLGSLMPIAIIIIAIIYLVRSIFR